MTGGMTQKLFCLAVGKPPDTLFVCLNLLSYSLLCFSTCSSLLFVSRRSLSLKMVKGKKKTGEEKAAESKSVKASFVGGPKDGTVLQVVNPPPKYLRLVDGIKDWCTYEWDKSLSMYKAVGNVRIKQPLIKGEMELEDGSS